MGAKRYTLTVVYPTDDSFEKLDKTVGEWLKKAKADVVAKDEWGQKTLSYPIKKHEEGIFQHVTLEVEPKEIAPLRQKLQFEAGILRWLLVSDEVVKPRLSGKTGKGEVKE